MKIKSWKTTAVACFAGLLILSGIVLVGFEKATLREVGIFGGAISPFIVMLLGFWAKDANVTHSNRSLGTTNPPPEKDEK